MFTHLYLENWRNFSRVDLTLQPRIFLVGANASGKSNLLDAFRFLRDIVSVGGGLQEAVERRGGVSRIRALSARRSPDVSIRVEVKIPPGNMHWRYSLSFGNDKTGRPIIKAETVEKQGSKVLQRPGDEDKNDRERLLETYLESNSSNAAFREIAEFFREISYLHIIPQLVREPDRSAGFKNDPFGGDFLEQVAKTPIRLQRKRLAQIVRALKVAVPQLKQLKLERDQSRGTPHLLGKYKHWRPAGAWQNEEQLSDGTIRLLGLLWAISEGKGPLLLEEPEMSLHPAVVRFIPPMLSRIQERQGRQVLVSTHSNDLLQDQGIGMNEVVLLITGEEGTKVQLASSIADVKELLNGGLSIADAVLPHTQPENVEQLTLFSEWNGKKNGHDTLQGDG